MGGDAGWEKGEERKGKERKGVGVEEWESEGNQGKEVQRSLKVVGRGEVNQGLGSEERVRERMWREERWCEAGCQGRRAASQERTEVTLGSAALTQINVDPLIM